VRSRMDSTAEVAQPPDRRRVVRPARGLDCDPEQGLDVKGFLTCLHCAAHDPSTHMGDIPRPSLGEAGGLNRFALSIDDNMEFRIWRSDSFDCVYSDHLVVANRNHTCEVVRIADGEVLDSRVLTVNHLTRVKAESNGHS
jgi:hypothetical protein